MVYMMFDIRSESLGCTIGTHRVRAPCDSERQRSCLPLIWLRSYTHLTAAGSSHSQLTAHSMLVIHSSPPMAAAGWSSFS